MNVLQFICPTGLYGAERWVLALAANVDPKRVNCELCITSEDASRQFELLSLYPRTAGATHRIELAGRFDVRAITRLTKLIGERSIDLIHTHGYKSDLIGLAAARRAGIRCVSTPHGFGDQIGWKLRLFIAAGGRALRHFDAIAPLSEELLDRVRSMGVDEARLRLIRNGVDLSEIDEFRGIHDEPSVVASDRPPESLDVREQRIGFIGQMIARKEIQLLLDTFERLHAKMANTRLQLIGDGDERKRLEGHAERLHSRESIEFPGFRGDRLALMHGLDVFVMTSSSEGIPRCMMEAMAMGVPVAAFDIPGVDQLIENGESGLLVPFGDCDALATAIQRILTEPDLAWRLAANARRTVESRYSARRMAGEYTELFSELVDN